MTEYRVHNNAFIDQWFIDLNQEEVDALIRICIKQKRNIPLGIKFLRLASSTKGMEPITYAEQLDIRIPAQHKGLLTHGRN